MIKRIIPILLLKDRELVKSIKFRDHRYIGDIINVVKIYNELEVDEILLMDITNSNSKSEINYKLISQIATEGFMPLTYGGNVNSINKIEKLIKIGVEKVCINTASKDYDFVKKAVEKYGSSTISICVDYKYNKENEPIIYFSNGKIKSKYNVINHISALTKLNVGEIILQNIEKDGTYNDYDFSLLNKIKKIVKNPLVLAGGCKDISSIKKGFDNGANACAAGSLFIYYSNIKGILINYPDKEELENFEIFR